MADVRNCSGTPTVAMFADLGWPLPGGTPLVVDTVTGDGYVLVAGVVTKIASNSYGTGTIGGSTGTTDNAIVRANGTGGSTLQGQTSGGPVLNDDGSVVNTAQPCFCAYNSASDANQTGNGAVATVICDNERFDQGGDYDNTTGTFTAPVAGKLTVLSQVTFDAINNATADAIFAVLVTSNQTYASTIQDANDIATLPSIPISVTVDMDANDTALLQGVVTGMAGDTASIYGNAVAYTFFSGALAC